MTFMVLVALLVVVGVVVAIAVVLMVLRSSRASAPTAEDVAAVPADVHALRAEVAALRAEAAQSLRHLGLVRYDAFGDMGGQLSWSLALVDDHGDGVVLTSIHGRSDARSYAKSVQHWSSAQALSPEEGEAITLARS